MASGWYNRYKKEGWDGTVALLTDTIKAMLVTSVYTFDPDHDFVDMGGASDPVDAELTGTGYVAGYAGAGRKTLASKTITESDADNAAYFDAADLAWTAIGPAGTVAAVILFKNGTSDDTTSKLVAYVEISPVVITNGGDYTVVWASTGILKLA